MNTATRDAPPLSKSKLMACRQCPRRLWLEWNRPELREDSPQTRATFAMGHAVGEVARRQFDPRGCGVLVERETVAEGLARSKDALRQRTPLFEVGLAADGAYAFTDVLLPVRRQGRDAWRLIEVKSSTKVKDYYYEDVAIQAFLAQRSGIPLASVEIARVDSSWTYPGNGDYEGLLVTENLSKDTAARQGEVGDWITTAQAVLRKRSEPDIATGKHCHEPYDCGFLHYCESQEPKVRYPIQWLPGALKKELKALIEHDGLRDMGQVPDALLNSTQRRVKRHTLSGKPYFDGTGAADALRGHATPHYFLDFETVSFAVPIWKGTRPYQQIPFQFVLVRQARNGKLERSDFLDLSGNDPSLALASALIAACGETGTIYAYNASFEAGIIEALAERFPKLRRELRSIRARLFDLLKVTRDHYYHPAQQGSWSIKSVLPTLGSSLDYAQLEGVQDGGMAADAYRQAIAPGVTPAQKMLIENQLKAYCGVDVAAMTALKFKLLGKSLDI